MRGGDCLGHPYTESVMGSNGLCCFSWWSDRIPDRNHLREERFIMVYCFSVQDAAA